MKDYLKGAWMSFKDYGIFDILFVVFMVPILSLGKDNLIVWIQYYSLAVFLIMLLVLYADFHHLAVKEKRPQYDLKPYPLKGFVYGFISIIPMGLLGLLYVTLTFSDPILDRMKHLVFNCLVGPEYWLVKLGNETALAYVGAVLLIPVITGLSYLAGNLGIYLKKSNRPGYYTNKNKDRGAKR